MIKESKIKWSEFISGDNDAYVWIYNTYIHILYSYGLRFTKDTEVIKDCIQDIFVRLYKNRNNLTIPDNIKVYLFISLKNSLIRTLYKEYRFDHDIEMVKFVLEPTVEDQFIAKEEYDNEQKKLQEILSLLSPRQKEIIYYRYIQELTFEEICNLMDLNYQSAQNLIQRSLKKVRDSYVSMKVFILLLTVYSN